MLVSSLLVTAMIMSASSAPAPFQHVRVRAVALHGADIEAIGELAQRFGSCRPP
jgi:hypothetical protein